MPEPELVQALVQALVPEQELEMVLERGLVLHN